MAFLRSPIVLNSVEPQRLHLIRLARSGDCRERASARAFFHTSHSAHTVLSSVAGRLPILAARTNCMLVSTKLHQACGASLSALKYSARAHKRGLFTVRVIAPVSKYLRVGRHGRGRKSEKHVILEHRDALGRDVKHHAAARQRTILLF